jgi:hypothetical protein
MAHKVPLLKGDRQSVGDSAVVAPLNRPDEASARVQTAAIEGVVSSTEGADAYFAKHSSFRTHDQFFHCMLSYRVNSEGPFESTVKCGNDLARLIWHSCSHCISSKPQNQDALLNDEITTKTMLQSLQAIGQFGKWPKVFPNPTRNVRIFLDQKNLRPGVDWKGSGKLEDGGFLGALSSSLMIVPLLSATPVRFKIKPTGEGRCEFSTPVNIAIPGGTESLEIFRDSSADSFAVSQSHVALLYTCTDFRPNGSFILNLQSVSDGNSVTTVADESFLDVLFWTPKYILPSDGSGSRGSLSEMLTIKQKSEALSFCVIEEPSPEFVILEIVELSDHVFYKNEVILLHLERDSMPHALAIDAVQVQGSKYGGVHSRVRVGCGHCAHLWVEILRNQTFRGTTVADERADRKDNVLMEMMLTRALHLVFADDTNPHPCKLIFPVFVDDLDVLWAVSQRLSTEVSCKTAELVEDSLQKVLRRPISDEEKKKLISVSVKDAVQFIAGLQGLQLSTRENRSKTINDKAELVCCSIVSTIGIEADMYSFQQYISDNPLAHELLDFINQEDIGHTQRSLMKMDVTSLKTFSELSSKSIKAIADVSRKLSNMSEVREIADIQSAVHASKASPYINPVSQRLANFEDKDASFMTIIYSTYAMEQGLTKPLFGIWFFVVVGITTVILAVIQLLDGAFGDAAVNLARFFTACLIVLFLHGFKSIRWARFGMFIGFILIGLASFASILIDQLFDKKIVWGSSSYCLTNYHKSQSQVCLQFLYILLCWQGFFYVVLAPFILYKQELVWRGWNIGISLYAIVNLVSKIYLDSAEFGDYLASTAFPSILVGTEFLKFYGSLQAIRLTDRNKAILCRSWKDILDDPQKHIFLQNLVKCVREACPEDSMVLDCSKDLGKWRSATDASVAPPAILQATSNFDELYRRANSLNDTFQLWIESFFDDTPNPREFVYMMSRDGKRTHIPFKGAAIRGPVKRPHRAIAKVFVCLSLT